jgi:hypothetical protein
MAEPFTTIRNQKPDVLMMIRCPALLLPGLLSLATTAFAAGVDCNKATDPIDKKVCADPKLLRMEEARDARHVPNSPSGILPRPHRGVAG